MSLTELLDDAQREAISKKVNYPIVSLREAWEALASQRFNGEVIAHFRNGSLVELRIPRHLRIRVE